MINISKAADEADVIPILHHFVLLNACTFMQVTEDLPKPVQLNFL